MKKTSLRQSIFIRGCITLIICGGIAACGEGTPSATGTLALPTSTAVAEGVSNIEYTVVNLSENGFGDENSISPQGKVIFNELNLRDGNTGGKSLFTSGYYDGTRVYPVLETVGLVFAVNDAGQVVGTRGSNGKLRQFIWTVGGGAVDLLPEATTNGLAVDINAAGEVAFLIEDPQKLDRQLLYRWKDGVASPASGFPNGTSLGLVRNNAEGAIAGDYVVTPQTPPGSGAEGHSYVWKDGSITDLGILGERQPNLYYTAEVKNINDSGQVIGNSSTKTSGSYSKTQAFAWTPPSGKMTPLGSLRSDKTGASFAFHSNNLGQVVGNAVTDNGTLHGYSWTDAGGMIDLTPDLSDSEAKAVNNVGQVVGYFGPSPQTASGFLWSASTGLIDLNTRTPRALRESGFRILTGVAISDTGSILAMSSTGLVLLIPGVPSAAAPSVGQINGNTVLAIGAPLALSATFVDADAADTHVAQWTWGDGASSGAALTESGGTGTVAGNYAYATSGIYTATLTVTDNTGRSARVSKDIVVYDPSAGYVTGGGWIQSPPGAYRADASLSGRATFGFVSKYERGATVPSGHTQFRFVSAKFGFGSTSYDWLVIAGARAQYKGTGALNGVDGYKFMLTAVDGDKAGQADRFRIKIFHTDPDSGADVIDYDNQTTGGTEGTLNEGTMVNGGSIVVHKS
jgi:probable HAF family extracellular repeat protein